MKKNQIWREFNLADFRQIRQISQIFFPPKFLPLRYLVVKMYGVRTSFSVLRSTLTKRKNMRPLSTDFEMFTIH